MREWAIAYLVTCVVEIPLVVLLIHGLGWRTKHRLEPLAMAWLLQATHPVLWLVHPVGVPAVAIGELAVVVVEAAALGWWAVVRVGEPRTSATVERSLLIALIANASSFLVGLALSAWLGVF